MKSLRFGQADGPIVAGFPAAVRSFSVFQNVHAEVKTSGTVPPLNLTLLRGAQEQFYTGYDVNLVPGNDKFLYIFRVGAWKKCSTHSSSGH
jgi:hypothetical protein